MISNISNSSNSHATDSSNDPNGDKATIVDNDGSNLHAVGETPLKGEYCLS